MGHKRFFGFLVALSLLAGFIPPPTGYNAVKAEQQVVGYKRGVNMSCAESTGGPSPSVPGTPGTNYAFVQENAYKYFAQNGLNLFRVPVLWERLQPTLRSPLNSYNKNGLKNSAAWAKKYGGEIIISIHNYNAYFGKAIGSDYVSVDDFIDLWIKLSDEFKNDDGVYAYDLMNEPVHISSISWEVISQMVVSAIRANGDNKTIIIEGNSWSSAERWPYSNNVDPLTGISNGPWINDPADNIVYSAHCYFDHDASGVYSKTYTQELAANPDLVNIGVKRVMPFIDWCKRYNVRGYIGEFNAPTREDGKDGLDGQENNRWKLVMEKFLQTLDYECIDSTAWSAGMWWGKSKLNVFPVDQYADEFQQDSVMMAVLKLHPSNPYATKPDEGPTPITYSWPMSKVRQLVTIGSNSKMYNWFDGYESGQDNWFEDNTGRTGFFRPNYWAVIDFEKSYDMTNYRFVSSMDSITKGFTFYGSSDGINWTQIAEPITNNTKSEAVGTFYSGTRVRYVKVQITIPNQGAEQTNGWFNVQEIQIFGDVNPYYFNVTFDSMGGSAVAPYENVEESSLLLTPTAPSKAGLIFAGWYKDAALTAKWNFATDKVSTNTTLYAKWTSSLYSVTFDSMGGSAIQPYMGIADGELIDEPQAPIWAGCIFNGWYKDAEQITKWNFGTDTVNDNITLYAKWIPHISSKIIDGWSQQKIKSSIAFGTLGNGNNPGEALNDGWKVFDGNTGSAWVFEENANRDGYWIAIDLGQNHQITSYKITCATNQATIKGFKFQVSEDGLSGNYTDTDVVITDNPINNTPIMNDCDIIGRYIKFKVTTPNHYTNGNGWLTLYEVELYGMPALDVMEGNSIEIRNFALLNSATRQCISKEGLINEDMSVIADIKNIAATQLNEIVMLAGIYDKHTGKLISVNAAKQNSIASGETVAMDVRISVPNGFINTGNYIIRAFIWKDENRLQPITQIGEFGNNI